MEKCPKCGGNLEKEYIQCNVSGYDMEILVLISCIEDNCDYEEYK